MRYAWLIVLLAAAAWGQPQRDFLTEDEADQIRLVQEPNERVNLYLKFARLRLELVKQTLAVEKPGRSRLIHNNLEDYTRIIEALDNVLDDALARKIDIQKGVALVAEQEQSFLATLREFDARQAKDRYLYEFVLKDAMEATQDSLEESQHDLAARTERVIEEDRRDKKKIESMTTVKDREEKKAAEQKEEKKARKVPTLRRKGEPAEPRPN
jgi:hypothetical protein